MYVRAFHVRKTKIVTFIRFYIKVSHAENSVSTLFFSDRLYPRKVIRHMTCDFDLREVDLDVQMTFINAAPFIS